MKHQSMRKVIRIQKLQNRHHMVGQSFSTLGKDERRIRPWLGGSWFQPGREQELANYIKQYEAETARLLKINPNLKLVS